MGFEYNEALALVAAVETRSEHPIVEATVVAATQRDITLAPIEGFDATLGNAINARCLDGVDLSPIKAGHFDGRSL